VESFNSMCGSKFVEGFHKNTLFHALSSLIQCIYNMKYHAKEAKSLKVGRLLSEEVYRIPCLFEIRGFSDLMCSSLPKPPPGG
jgi:hypothetical protein